MVTARVRAVANVMGIRRGDEGDVELGHPLVDAMVNRGYLEVLGFPSPPPAPKTAPRKAAKKSGSNGKSASRPRPSRSRSKAVGGPAGDAGNAADAREGLGTGPSADGKPAGPDGDVQTGDESVRAGESL